MSKDVYSQNKEFGKNVFINSFSLQAIFTAAPLFGPVLCSPTALWPADTKMIGQNEITLDGLHAIKYKTQKYKELFVLTPFKSSFLHTPTE